MSETTYYSTLRPISIGTYPRHEDNKVLHIEHFPEGRRLINGEFLAWGSITYERPLDEREAYRYDLAMPKAYPPEFLRRPLGSMCERIVKRAHRVLAGQGIDEEGINAADRLSVGELSDLLGKDFVERMYALQMRYER